MIFCDPCTALFNVALFGMSYYADLERRRAEREELERRLLLQRLEQERRAKTKMFMTIVAAVVVVVFAAFLSHRNFSDLVGDLASRWDLASR
jgi:hypothetical protein